VQTAVNPFWIDSLFLEVEMVNSVEEGFEGTISQFDSAIAAQFQCWSLTRSSVWVVLKDYSFVNIE